MFDEIDKNADSIIDQKEWMELHKYITFGEAKYKGLYDTMGPLYQYSWPCREKSADRPATPIVAIVGE